MSVCARARTLLVSFLSVPSQHRDEVLRPVRKQTYALEPWLCLGGLCLLLLQHHIEWFCFSDSDGVSAAPNECV